MSGLIPVKSSNLVAIGFAAGDTDTAGVLSIEFKGGATYDYAEFPVELWDEFKDAESAGSFFHAKIRGQFEGQKRLPVEDDAE